MLFLEAVFNYSEAWVVISFMKSSIPLKNFRSRLTRSFVIGDEVLAPVVTMGKFSLNYLLLFVAALLSFASAWDISNENDRHGCQSYSQNPLDGCDQSKTSFVGVSGKLKFKTVQSGMNRWETIRASQANSFLAVASVPNNIGK
jgi:hypothetical protein